MAYDNVRSYAAWSMLRAYTIVAQHECSQFLKVQHHPCSAKLLWPETDDSYLSCVTPVKTPGMSEGKYKSWRGPSLQAPTTRGHVADACRIDDYNIASSKTKYRVYSSLSTASAFYERQVS